LLSKTIRLTLFSTRYDGRTGAGVRLGQGVLVAVGGADVRLGVGVAVAAGGEGWGSVAVSEGLAVISGPAVAVAARLDVDLTSSVAAPPA
jgi:hypothetical protein